MKCPNWKEEVCGNCFCADWLPEEKATKGNEGFCRAIPPAVIMVGINPSRLAGRPPIPVLSSKYRPVSKDMPACALFTLDAPEEESEGT